MYTEKCVTNLNEIKTKIKPKKKTEKKEKSNLNPT